MITVYAYTLQYNVVLFFFLPPPSHPDCYKLLLQRRVLYTICNHLRSNSTVDIQVLKSILFGRKKKKKFEAVERTASPGCATNCKSLGEKNVSFLAFRFWLRRIRCFQDVIECKGQI